MKRSELVNVFGTEHPVLGMIHLPPLPGSPCYGGSMDDVITHAFGMRKPCPAMGSHP